MYTRLLSEDQLNRVKDKFNEDIDAVLEDAIRKHVSIYWSNGFSITKDQEVYQWYFGCCWHFLHLTIL